MANYGVFERGRIAGAVPGMIPPLALGVLGNHQGLGKYQVA